MPPELVDRVVRALHVGVGCLPVLFAVVLPFPGASTVDWWLRAGLAGLIAVQVLWFDWKKSHAGMPAA